MTRLCNRIYAKPGDTYGIRTLVKIVDSCVKGKNKTTKWLWKCACGTTGIGEISNLRRSYSCKDCSRYYSKTQEQGGHKPGVVVGCFKIIESIQQTDRWKKKKYKVECTRCGYVFAHKRVCGKALTQKACIQCRNKYDMQGILLSLVEIEALFSIKRSLIMHRLGRNGMSLEEAVFTPVQKQNHSRRVA